MIELYFSMVKILAQKPTHTSTVAAVLLRERGGGGGGGEDHRN